MSYHYNENYPEVDIIPVDINSFKAANGELFPINEINKQIQYIYNPCFELKNSCCDSHGNFRCANYYDYRRLYKDLFCFFNIIAVYKPESIDLEKGKLNNVVIEIVNIDNRLSEEQKSFVVRTLNILSYLQINNENYNPFSDKTRTNDYNELMKICGILSREISKEEIKHMNSAGAKISSNEEESECCCRCNIF